MDIKSLADKYEPYIIERRHYYHSHPELSLEEKETSASIKKDLEEMGLEVKQYTSCYGLSAIIKGSKPGKTVALRADFDALCVKEMTGLPFASQNEGKMHACGHDTHIAMILGAAKILVDLKDQIAGNVKLILQPAEEVAEGAKRMVAEGVLDGVDVIYGAHIWGNIDAPLIDVEPGKRMAGADLFKITVKGLAAHGSTPENGVDAIVAASAIVMNLQTFVSRINSPVSPLVVTVGKFNGGTRFNIIPNEVVLEGALRYYKSARDPEDVINNIIQNTAKALGATASMEYTRMLGPVENDSGELAKIAREAVVKLYGEESLSHAPAVMGSEDFAFYLEKVPGIFAFIGSKDEKQGYVYANHHEKYTMDESIFKRGSAVMAQFAFDFLAKNA